MSRTNLNTTLKNIAKLADGRTWSLEHKRSSYRNRYWMIYLDTGKDAIILEAHTAEKAYFKLVKALEI